MKKEIETGSLVELKSGSKVEVRCYLNTNPRTYAVRSQIGSIFSVNPKEIVKILRKPQDDALKLNLDMIKKARQGDKEAVRQFIKKFKKMPNIRVK